VALALDVVIGRHLIFVLLTEESLDRCLSSSCGRNGLGFVLLENSILLDGIG